jgi:hypothetical protein
MASKKFDSLGGVIMTRTIDGKEVKRSSRCDSDHQDEYSITSIGDVLFEIDLENRKINKCNAKYVVKDRHGMLEIRYCDAAINRDFKPTYDTFYGRGLPKGMKLCHVLYNKSVYGLLATNMNDALDRFQKINDGHYFGALKKGDKLYIVDKEGGQVIEDTVESIQYNNNWYNDGGHFNIITKHYRFNCYNSEFEENASAYSDPSFYISMGKKLDEKKTSIHLDKAVAEKVLREYLNNRKNVKKKNDEKPKIPEGTPIRHTDNKDNELHYGDTVAYVRKDYWGHTDISYGVIVGDSEKKIKIYDQEEYKAAEEKRKKKQALWNYEKNNDGTHMLEPVNVLLMKLAVAK